MAKQPITYAKATATMDLEIRKLAATEGISYPAAFKRLQETHPEFIQAVQDIRQLEIQMKELKRR